MSLEYIPIAKEALVQYGLERADVRFIRHNENIAVEVNAGTESYLLRIHEPKSEGFIGDWQKPERVEAELRWLQILNEDQALVTQKPVPTTHRSLVGKANIKGKERPCSLLTWINGVQFDPKSSDAPKRARQLGQLIAVLHGHSVPPVTLDRPSYDTARFKDTVEKLKVSVDLGFLTSAHYESMKRICGSITKMLDQEQRKGKWGLIHSDLGPSNVIVHERGVSPIDFSLSGYGPLLWDIGGMLPAYPKELRKALFDSYSELSPIKEEEMRLCEGLAILSIISCWAFHISNPDQHEWLQHRMPKSVENEWLKFERDERFLFEL